MKQLLHSVSRRDCRVLAAAALLLAGQSLGAAGEPATPVPPELSHGDLAIRYKLEGGKLRQVSFLPTSLAGIPLPARPADPLAGVEVAVQVTGGNWAAHHAKKLVGGAAGIDLIYAERYTVPSALGIHEVLVQTSHKPGLRVESHYQFVEGAPVVRRWTRVTNEGREVVGLEQVSSAMVYAFADFGARPLEDKLRIHYANNSWKSEAQWRTASPAELGFSDNGTFNLNAISFGNLGSMSSMSQLPAGMVENRELGVTWCWQIEHNGGWHWEISNTANGTSYLYLGGPDAIFSGAWKELAPGASYETVPVAIGCVAGGFDEAVAAMTVYRRKACLPTHADNRNCPVIFNDYMNCLFGQPTTAKELPLIDAAAAAGCEYYVIDAGWYAEENETWWDTVGLWQPSKTRWGTQGLQGVLDRIKAKGMVPGLWLEIEVAGINSPLKDKPDAWFMMRHGRRVIDNGRFFLDFRNPEVRAYADKVIDRIVRDYGVGYLKIDYNVEAQLGTESGAESFGQGLLGHQRAYLAWLDQVHTRYPSLVIENCGSGGGRMDYAMLSHTQLQSSSDQTDYSKYPSIVGGGLAAVLPEQLAVWSYPRTDDNADAASFNMVNAMLARIHQSGHLATLNDACRAQVVEGIRVYKQSIRSFIPDAVPFFPLGMPAMSDPRSPVAVGLRAPGATFLAAWRLEGDRVVRLPAQPGRRPRLLYPVNLGIQLKESPAGIEVVFPRKHMAAILQFE